MKKSLILFMALILGISMLAGCGGAPAQAPTQVPEAVPTNAPAPTPSESAEPTPEPTPTLGPLIEEPYFSLNEAGDWVFEDNSGYLTLVKSDPESDSEMCIYTSANLALSSPEKGLEDALFFEDAVQGDNVTYNGIEYMFVERSVMPMITLIAVETHTVKAAFDDADDHEVVMTIEIYDASLEEVEPVLQTIKFNEKIVEQK